jgi:flavin reductase (DIM6/NTAB) family NADH-FMN oxidoreductase RutF
MTRHEPAALPDWPPGTVAILSTGGGEPHAIPVSTGVKAGPRAILLALAVGRESLARLREDPRCAVTVLAAGDVAVTAVGHATVVEDPMHVADNVVAVRIGVERIQDHWQDGFVIEDGASWRWTDDDAARRDAVIREALERLAGEG